jgi:hypothetical protein
MWRALVLAVLAGLTTAGGSSAASDQWKPLYRPLEIPRLAAGKPCPVSRVDASVPFRRFGIAPGLGSGPAYPVGFQARDSSLALAPPRNFGSRRWGGQKVMWFVHQRYRGPVLVRGLRLDRAYRVRFDQGNVPRRELRIGSEETVSWPGQPRGSRGKPSYTRLRGPGCYGYQIDGTTFSRVVVFRARG